MPCEIHDSCDNRNNRKLDLLRTFVQNSEINENKTKIIRIVDRLADLEEVKFEYANDFKLLGGAIIDNKTKRLKFKAEAEKTNKKYFYGRNTMYQQLEYLLSMLECPTGERYANKDWYPL